MSFAESQLLPGDPLIILAQEHPFVLFKPLWLNAVASAVVVGIAIFSRKAWIVACFLIPLVCLVQQCLAGHKRESILTDRRAVKHEGVPSVSSFDAPLDKTNNVFRRQGFFGRLPKCGEIGLETASEQGSAIFDFLSHPLDFKNAAVRQRGMDGPDSRTAGKTPRTGNSAPDRRIGLAARSENHHGIRSSREKEKCFRHDVITRL